MQAERRSGGVGWAAAQPPARLGAGRRTCWAPRARGASLQGALGQAVGEREKNAQVGGPGHCGLALSVPVPSAKLETATGGDVAAGRGVEGISGAAFAGRALAGALWASDRHCCGVLHVRPEHSRAGELAQPPNHGPTALRCPKRPPRCPAELRDDPGARRRSRASQGRAAVVLPPPPAPPAPPTAAAACSPLPRSCRGRRRHGQALDPRRLHRRHPHQAAR